MSGGFLTYVTLDGKVCKMPRLRPSDIVIAVMGETGSGKSTFIHNFNEHAEIGYGAESKTDKITAFEAHVNGKLIFLVDTIGTNDAERKEGYILQQMAQWLSAAAEKDVYLSGLIYLFNITKTRVTDSDTHELRKFKNLCGQNAFKESRITLATTFWSELSDEGIARAGVTEKLFEDWFWKDTPSVDKRPVQRILGRSEARKMLEVIVRGAGRTTSTTIQGEPEWAYISLQGEICERPRLRPGEIVLAIIGETGCGKSTLIYHFNEHAQVAFDDKPTTQSIMAYEACLNNQRIFLLDTMGIQSHERNERHVLRQLTTWFSSAAVEGVHLTGIIYLRDILKPQIRDPDSHDLAIFKPLFGEHAPRFHLRIRLATTFWDVVHGFGSTERKATAEAKEKWLKKWFWENSGIDAAKIPPTQRIQRQRDAFKLVKIMINPLIQDELLPLKLGETRASEAGEGELETKAAVHTNKDNTVRRKQKRNSPGSGRSLLRSIFNTKA
ncbi:hypothetical protein QBC38DRAFT_514785 [Podospora fimiseda]|uniref:G domain-containing protein n=1 Tax=Podospora fimiseda TaxID=252190 RepID=A0AAN7GUA2_9PEZI|nr:hypothetical protein QBC38DRAFT_514785 [Podospora fimiseda]